VAEGSSFEDRLRHAMGLHEKGLIDQAALAYDALLQINPENPAALHMRGVICYQRGELESALRYLDTALHLLPEDAAAISNRGLVLRGLKRPQEALSAYDAALRRQPEFAQAWSNRGNVLRDLNRCGEAVDSYKRACVLQPDFASAWHGLGLALSDLRRWAEAVAAFDSALVCKPDFSVAYLDRGNALRELEQPEQALASYDRALQANLRYPQAWSNRGVVLKRLGRFDESLVSYQKALTFKPDFVDAMVNCSTLLKDMLRLEEAIQLNERALSIDPSASGAHLNLAICQLLQGKFPEGLPHFEWRWNTDQLRDSARSFTQPAWRTGETLAGPTVLLHAEQGLGDTIQFCRYAAMAARQGLRVVLEVQPVLVDLLQGLEGAATVVARGSTLPSFDAHCPLMSLPLVMETTLATIPAPSRYIGVQSVRSAVWRKTLGEVSQKRVGLVWSGRPEHKNDHNRSIPLADYALMLDSRCDYHCLQKEIRREDLHELQSRTDIRSWSQDLDSFVDTAALIECMDLVVAVDTSVAHLAAAMGKPVWLLLPYSPDWRWLLERTDTPWYPSMTLFRQRASGDWSDVVRRVGAALTQWAN
jgi:tetratricopeptide (TPR) repeat protein